MTERNTSYDWKEYILWLKGIHLMTERNTSYDWKEYILWLKGISWKISFIQTFKKFITFTFLPLKITLPWIWTFKSFITHKEMNSPFMTLQYLQTTTNFIIAFEQRISSTIILIEISHKCFTCNFALVCSWIHIYFLIAINQKVDSYN